MKILFINKFHYLRGGAERAYFDMAEVFTAHSHDVAFFSMKHPENKFTEWEYLFIDEVDYNDKNLNFWQKIKAALKIIYNFQARHNLKMLLEKYKPDLVHFHNIYHQISPSLFGVLKKQNIPTVMTLHDYKLICPSYNLFVRGNIWERSKPDKYWRCFTDKCVDDSYMKSLICTIEAYLHKILKSYEKIDSFIAPSLFLINKFKEFGFKKEIYYIPNPLLGVEKYQKKESGEKGKYILYFGRLSKEKGVEDLLVARQQSEDLLPLKIVGTGLEERRLRKIVEEKNILNVEFLGYKTGDELWGLIRDARLVVMPSRCYENSPYGALEAMALGKIILAANLGGLAELINDGENGFLFRAGDVKDLREKISYILSNPKLEERIGKAAKKSVAENNDKEKYYEKLMEIYKKTIENK